MWPDRESNTGPLALKSDAPLAVLRGPAYGKSKMTQNFFPRVRLTELT